MQQVSWFIAQDKPVKESLTEVKASGTLCA